MKNHALIALLLLLAACREETTIAPNALELTPETIGFYCQMNVLEHPGPKAQVHLDGLPGAPLFFSQVRDAIAYQRMPEQSHKITAIFVNDMGAAPSWEIPGVGNWVPMSQVIFVVGSNRTGGMGVAELVPFIDPTKAADFATAYGGAVMTLDAIPDSAVFPEEIPDDAGDEDFKARLKTLGLKTGG